MRTNGKIHWEPFHLPMFYSPTLSTLALGPLPFKTLLSPTSHVFSRDSQSVEPNWVSVIHDSQNICPESRIIYENSQTWSVMFALGTRGPKSYATETPKCVAEMQD